MNGEWVEGGQVCLALSAHVFIILPLAASPQRIPPLGRQQRLPPCAALCWAGTPCVGWVRRLRAAAGGCACSWNLVYVIAWAAHAEPTGWVAIAARPWWPAGIIHNCTHGNNPDVKLTGGSAGAAAQPVAGWGITRSAAQCKASLGLVCPSVMWLACSPSLSTLNSQQSSACALFPQSLGSRHNAGL